MKMTDLPTPFALSAKDTLCLSFVSSTAPVVDISTSILDVLCRVAESAAGSVFFSSEEDRVAVSAAGKTKKGLEKASVSEDRPPVPLSPARLLRLSEEEEDVERLETSSKGRRVFL